MKKTDGGGWKGVAIGFALAAPWLIGNMLAGPRTAADAMQIEELSPVQEARGTVEKEEPSLEGLCSDPTFRALAGVGFKEL